MQIKYFKTVLLGVIFLQSCTIANHIFVENKQKPGPDSRIVGIIGISKPTGNNLEDIKPMMESNCSDWGGLKESSISRANPSSARMFTDYWSYSCNGLSQSQSSAPVEQQIQYTSNNKADIPKAKQKCTELGFKSGTEGFGKCVLKLTK